MGEKFSWERLLKRNGAEATDNTIDLVPETAPMGPVAPLQASRPPMTPPVDSAEAGKPRPPLVIDWDEYQQLEQANPVAVQDQLADVPPAAASPTIPNIPQVPPVEVPAQPVASIDSVVPPAPFASPEPVAPSSPESNGSFPANQFWDKLGDATSQAFSAPHAPSAPAPVVAGWDDVELTPREKDGAMRISSDQLAGTVDPESFKPIAPQSTIEETIQSISQSSAWDEADSFESSPTPVPSAPETPSVTETPSVPPTFKAPPAATPLRDEPAPVPAEPNPISFEVPPTIEAQPVETQIGDEPAPVPAEPNAISFEVPPTADLPPVASLPPIAEAPADSHSSIPSPPPAESVSPEPSPVSVPNTSSFWDSILAPQPADSKFEPADDRSEDPVESPAREISTTHDFAEPDFAPVAHEFDSAPPVPSAPAYHEPAGPVTPSTPADSLYELPNDDAALQEARDIRLGEVLVNHRLVTQSQIDRAMEIQQQSGKRLGEVLVSHGMVSERRLLQVLAAQKGVSPWHLDEDPPTPDALRAVPHELCQQHRVIPVSVRGELLLLAMRDTQDLAAIEAVRSFTGRRVEPVLADETLLAQAIDKATGQMSTANWIQAEEEAFDTAPIAPVAPAEEVVEAVSESKSLLQDLPKLDSVESAMDWLAAEEPLDAEPIVAMPEQFDFVPPAATPETSEAEASHPNSETESPEIPEASGSNAPEVDGLEFDEAVNEAFETNDWENGSTASELESEAFVQDQSVYEPATDEEFRFQNSDQPELVHEQASIDAEPSETWEPEAPAPETGNGEFAQDIESAEEFARNEEREPLNWHGSDLAAQAEDEIEFEAAAEEAVGTEESEAAELAERIEEVNAEPELLEAESPEIQEPELQADEEPEEVCAAPAVDLCAVLSQAAELDARSAHVLLRGGLASINIRTRCGSNATQLISSEELDHVLNELETQIGCDPRDIAAGDRSSFKAYLDDFEFEVQVSTLVTSLGFQVKLAFPRPKLSLLNWRELGLETENAKLVESLIHQPYGLFLIAGPADSGKTTTLYSLASELHRCGCTVVCCESEIQAALEDVEQVEIVDQDLNTILSSVLEQGPDRVFVGEITDATSANLVIEAALAGCAVIATIRAQDTSDVLRILGEWGVPPFRLARALNGVLAQRLIRTLGDGSYRTNEMTSAEAESLKTYFGNTQIRELPRAASTADWDGYRGRTAIHEVFVNSEETAALLAGGQPIDQVIETAGYYGYLPIRFDGLRRIAQGETTLDELRRTITLRPLRKSEPRTLAS